MKLVSVIIPVYNAEKYIQETLKSVYNQTYQHFEIIIVNDGSKDSTPKLLDKLNDDRITVIHQENKGVSTSRNNGIKQAKGDYIAILDADDVWESECLEKKIAFLDHNLDYDYVYSNSYTGNANAEKVEITKVEPDTNILDDTLLWIGEVIPAPCSNLVFRKTIIDTYNISFDPHLSTAADQDFCIQLASQCKGKLINEPLVIYRVLPNSMSRNINVMEQDHLYVYKKAVKNKKFRSFWFKQKCFSNLYLILAGSFWVNERNKLKGSKYIIKALWVYPPSFIKLIKKL